ncbi:MAG: DUF937 domain-containing protein [Pseudomonadota bacterium]
MAGLNLMDMLSGPAGRNAVGQLGQQFGLSEGQSAQAVAALLPALSSGLKRNVSQPGGLEALVGALGSGHHQQYLDQPAKLAEPGTVADGNAILGHLLGSKDVSRAAAARASQKTGISDTLMKQMLPLVATMVMGSLSKQKQDPNVGNLLMGALSGGGGQQTAGGGGGGLLGGILGSVMGGGRKAQPQQVQHGGGMAGMLGNLLDADKDGSAMDDIFEMLTKR